MISNDLNAQKSDDYVVTISTKLGDISLVLFDETPKHKENFLKLAKDKFYDGTTFHRVIKNFMIQGGDPNSKEGGKTNEIGMGGPSYLIDAEINPKFTHVKGAVAAARTGGPGNPQKKSSGSQFYIVQNATGTPHLNKEYSIFGQVIEGLDILDKIADVQKGAMDRPVEDIRMTVKVEKMSKVDIAKKYNVDWENIQKK